MTFRNGGQRDEYNPVRKMTRADWESEQQAALNELSAISGVPGEAWPKSAWSAGESRNRAYSYSKYTGSESPDDHPQAVDADEDNTMRDMISGVVENSMDQELPPYKAPQESYGLGFGGNHAYSKHTGADKGQSDEDWEWENIVNSVGKEPIKLPPNIKPLGGKSEYYKYDSRLYPKYDS